MIPEKEMSINLKEAFDLRFMDHPSCVAIQSEMIRIAGLYKLALQYYPDDVRDLDTLFLNSVDTLYKIVGKTNMDAYDTSRLDRFINDQLMQCDYLKINLGYGESKRA
jgi:hypothetical protein